MREAQSESSMSVSAESMHDGGHAGVHVQGSALRTESGGIRAAHVHRPDTHRRSSLSSCFAPRGAIVTRSGKQLMRFRASRVDLASMLALGLLLIPGKGPLGAVVALVCAEALLAAGSRWASRRAFHEASP